MSVPLPDFVDAWRMVAARRAFEGSLPIAGLDRLTSLLAGEDGMTEYVLEFGTDELGTAFLDLRAQAPLTLTCQRTLEPFVLPVSVHARLGLIRDESEEAALPPGYEPLLVPENGRLSPAAVIEDELVLAVPLVPVSPESEWPEGGVRSDPDAEPEDEIEENPFAVLRELKKH